MGSRRLARALLYAGVVAVVAGLGKVHAGTIAEPTYDFTGSFRFGWSIAYVVWLALVAYGAGLPDLARHWKLAVAVSTLAALAGALGVSVVQLLLGDALLPRFVVFGSALALVPWYLVCVAVANGGRNRAEERDRVVLVGHPSEAEVLRTELESTPERAAVLAGCLELDEARAGGGRRRPLVEEVVVMGGTVVVLDREAQVDESVVAQAAALHAAGVRVRTLTLFYEEWLGKLPVGELERVSLMFDIGEVHRARYGRVKRVLDLLLAAGGLLALAAILPVVVVGDLVANRGPLLFRQPRIGKQGRSFSILKFRTMRPGGTTTEWTGERDPRITPFGRVLRKSHLDELPQVLNILRGDLSFVGPRPEQPHYVAELAGKLPFYDLRHLVRPGLTGWAQVKYGYAGDERDALEKLQYEFFYLRRQGLALDLRIVGRTVRHVAVGGGR